MFFHFFGFNVLQPVRQLCEGWEIEALKFNLVLLLNRSTNVEFCNSPQLLQNCSLQAGFIILLTLSILSFCQEVSEFVRIEIYGLLLG